MLYYATVLPFEIVTLEEAADADLRDYVTKIKAKGEVAMKDLEKTCPDEVTREILGSVLPPKHWSNAYQIRGYLVPKLAKA